MTQTQTYKLPQWEKSDRILMEDFNGQSAKLEAALTAHDASLAALTSGKADKTTTSSLQTQVNQKADTTTLNGLVSNLQSQINGKTGIVTGSYQGDNAKSQTITLGFQPKAVLVLRKNGHVSTSSQGYAGLAFAGIPAKYKETTFLEVTSSGFIAGNSLDPGNAWATFLNDGHEAYHYIAFK